MKGWAGGVAENANHRRSMRTTEPASIVIGLWRFSICSTWLIDRPMPPCIQMIFFSISAAKGSQLNSLFIRCHVQIPSLSPYFWAKNINISTHTQIVVVGDFVNCSTQKGSYHSFYTLYPETKQSIDICSFMISTNQMYILRIFNLKYTVVWIYTLTRILHQNKSM